MNNHRDLFYLNKLILMALDDHITSEQLDHLNKILTEDRSAVIYYIEFMDIYTEMSCYGRVSLPMFASEDSELQSQRQLFEALAAYEKNAQAIKVNGEGKKKLNEQEREKLIFAFIEEEKRRIEEEEALKEEQARAKMQQQRHIRMKEIQRRNHLLKLQQAAKKTWKFMKITAAAAFVAFFAYIGYLLIQPVPVATLTATANAEWENPNFLGKIENRLLPGPMKLTKGLAQITFDDGAEVIIEAPSTISLEKSNQAFLELGRLSVQVPAYAQGFRIDTPSASIIDMGTEFGVEVTTNGTSDLHVFKGMVDVLAGDKKRKSNRKKQTVRAGFAKRIFKDNTHIRDISLKRSAFFSTIPSPYERAVRDSNPIAYWQFNKDDADISLNSMDSTTFTGKYIGGVAIEQSDLDLGDGKQNHTLLIHNQNEYMIVEDIPTERLQKQGLSIMLWFRPTELKEQVIVTIETKSEQPGWFSRYLSMTPDGYLTFRTLSDPEGSLSAESGETAFLESNEKVKIGQWHHLAVTLSENSVQLFINGNQKAHDIGPIKQFLDTNVMWYLCTGPDIEPEDENVKRELNFAIDELAIYNRTLSAQEIKDLYRSAQYNKQ